MVKGDWYAIWFITILGFVTNFFFLDLNLASCIFGSCLSFVIMFFGFRYINKMHGLT